MASGDHSQPALSLPIEEAELPSEAEAEVLRELARLHDQRPSWTNTIVTLVVSLVLFVGSGLLGKSWQDAWPLIPVLFFHELGHLAAMRLFGYRNLKMFFIPFFGAAASGRNLNVAGWKKAIIALAGPVPGIAVGAALAVAAAATHQEWLGRIALLLLILNGFNLLPLLPFDGGWVLHAIVFCRHPLLDVGFRALAVAGLGLLALTTGSWFLLLIAVPMAISLPIAFRIAKLVAELRATGAIVPAANQSEVPIPTALTIIRRINARIPGLPKSIAAQHTMNIFEMLNALPPGWLGSTLILGFHAASFVAAVFFSIVASLAFQPA